MTTCLRPSGPLACTESTEMFSRGFSRGGMPDAHWSATFARASSHWSRGRVLMSLSTAAVVATTASMTGRFMTPPATLTLATRGSFLNHTGWLVPPHGTVRPSSCCPGTTTSHFDSGSTFTYWFSCRWNHSALRMVKIVWVEA